MVSEFWLPEAGLDELCGATWGCGAELARPAHPEAVLSSSPRVKIHEIADDSIVLRMLSVSSENAFSEF